MPGRRWPRGCSRVIRDLRDGATVPAVIRRHGVPYRVAMALARRIRWQELRQDEAGATMVEYGLIATLIAVASFTVLGVMGTSLSSTFASVAANL
jgi:pilus assembly protein Flp/PilA